MEVNGQPARPLQALFDPASVAVVGASEDPRKWGNWLAVGALQGEPRRPAFLINHRVGRVLGRRAYGSLAELPQRPDLVVIAVPARVLSETVDAALAAGARAIVAISAGTQGSHGADGSLAARVRAAGAVLLGPNCLGVLDSGARLALMPNPLPAGSIALVSQSGNLALELGLLAQRAGVGFSRFASLGNQADIGATEVVADLVGHDPTRLIALYLEDFRDGRAFARAAAAAVACGKPVVALAIERTGATARSVRSHTGALASDRAAIEAACRVAGIERVSTPHELIDAAQALLRCRPARGRRVAVLADGGGHASIAAAVCARRGLELPRLGVEASGRLRAELPAGAAVSNPVDLAGAAEQDVHAFHRVSAGLLGGGEVDALLITGYFGGYGDYGEAMAAEEVRVGGLLGELARDAGRPLVVHTMYPDGPVAGALRDAGVPVYEAIERAVDSLERLCRPPSGGPRSIPPLPAPAPPVRDDGYVAARELLSAAGIPFAAQRTVADEREAAAAALQIGYPVVLKALGALHKSDSGGVALDLGDEPALLAALAQMRSRLACRYWSVERMAPVGEGLELLIGARWDTRFGPVALAGAGGVATEVLRDTAVALAPLDDAGAVALLQSLRAAALLHGARGRPALDVAAAAAALRRLSEVAAAHPELAEIEINPLLVCADGVLALDARFVRANPDEQEQNRWSSPTPPASSSCASAPSA